MMTKRNTRKRGKRPEVPALRLREVMDRCGVNHSELAARSGVSRANIYLMLGGGDPRVSTLAAVARALNVEVGALLGQTNVA